MRLQKIGDIEINLDYWDCNCSENYIQKIKTKKCKICNAEQDDCPSSRQNEVEILKK